MLQREKQEIKTLAYFMAGKWQNREGRSVLMSLSFTTRKAAKTVLSNTVCNPNSIRRGLTLNILDLILQERRKVEFSHAFQGN